MLENPSKSPDVEKSLNQSSAKLSINDFIESGRSVLKKADTNGDGALSKEEIKSPLTLKTPTWLTEKETEVLQSMAQHYQFLSQLGRPLKYGDKTDYGINSKSLLQAEGLAHTGAAYTRLPESSHYFMGAGLGAGAAFGALVLNSYLIHTSSGFGRVLATSALILGSSIATGVIGGYVFGRPFDRDLRLADLSRQNDFMSSLLYTKLGRFSR